MAAASSFEDFTGLCEHYSHTWCPMMLAIWRGAPGGAKNNEKIVNFAQLLTDGLRTTDWQKVFSCKPASSSL